MLRITMTNGKIYNSEKSIAVFQQELNNCESGYRKLIHFDNWDNTDLWLNPNEIVSVEVVERGEQ